jgi:phosphohistidine phosphatase SixA
VPIYAAGGVLWRPHAEDATKVRIALIHRPRYDDWTLPKGKCKPGEPSLLTAMRETAEETGHTGRAQRRLAAKCYRVGGTIKEVDYWLMRAGDGRFTPSEEVDQLRWRGPGKALRRLTYVADRELLEEFLEAPRPRSVVVLARHATAGKRSEWNGPDELRPLDPDGRRDARAMAALVTAFGPEAVYSADLVRCRQTASEVGAALGLPVTDVPELSDTAYLARPTAAADAFREFAAKHPASYVCSQGDAIPGLLTDLGVTKDVETRKGDFWVIGMDGSGVLFADYYRRPDD